jgi:hypothetical protein
MKLIPAQNLQQSSLAPTSTTPWDVTGATAWIND